MADSSSQVAAAGPAPEKRLRTSKSYGHLTFPRWQIRLLLGSSACFLLSSATALAHGARGLSLVLAVAGLASLNYWRAPGPSFRRDADIAAAACALVYCLYAGFWLHGVTGVVGWSSLLSGLACFRRSWTLSLGKDDSWAVYHAGAHALSNVAAVALATGVDATMAVASYYPPRNTLAELSVCSILAHAAYDVLVLPRL